jgi:hypothetical protein
LVGDTSLGVPTIMSPCLRASNVHVKLLSEASAECVARGWKPNETRVRLADGVFDKSRFKVKTKGAPAG